MLRVLKAAIFVPLVAVALVSIVVPLYYLYVASTLPNPIDGAVQIETHLRQSVESERQSVQYHKRVKDRDDVSWPTPDFSRLPKLLVALYITETGCPTYFQTPSETGWQWKKRVLYSVLNQQLEGDAGCELIFAQRLALRLGATTPMQIAVAADRIHEFLKKDQLVAFDLHSMSFTHGVIGVEAASVVLMQKPLLELDLAELAEFQLGIPPHDYWEEMRLCKNAPLVRQSRDALLDHLVSTGFVTPEMAKTASQPPPRCLSIVRAPP